MRYYEEELEVLIKAGAKVVEVASFEWERVHGFANYVAEDLDVDWYSWSSVSGLKVWTGNGFKVINSDCITLPQVFEHKRFTSFIGDDRQRLYRNNYSVKRNIL